MNKNEQCGSISLVFFCWALTGSCIYDPRISYHISQKKKWNLSGISWRASPERGKSWNVRASVSVVALIACERELALLSCETIMSFSDKSIYQRCPLSFCSWSYCNSDLQSVDLFIFSHVDRFRFIFLRYSACLIGKSLLSSSLFIAFFQICNLFPLSFLLSLDVYIFI